MAGAVRSYEAVPTRWRLPLLSLGFLALALGLWLGLVRLGWPLPASGELALLHGPLMVSGFFGTLIGLERAVALNARWAYGAPLATGLGTATLALGEPAEVGAALFTLGSAFFLAASLKVAARQRDAATAILALGALAWLIGNLLWLAGWAVPGLVLWWALFLTLTVAGERVELSRILQPSKPALAVFFAILMLLLAGGISSLFDAAIGWKLFGAGLALATLWLSRHDLARKTVKLPGLPRYAASCLLSGYVWLGVSGLCALLWSDPRAGFGYDAALHALFLGFIFAMVFGHAPIILPALAHRKMPFSRAFYAHLLLLHASVALRVGADIAGWTPGRLWAGALNVAAILLFIALTAQALRRGSVSSAKA